MPKAHIITAAGIVLISLAVYLFLFIFRLSVSGEMKMHVFL